FTAYSAHVSHQFVNTGGTSNSQGMYAQVAYRLPWMQRTLKPYYRFDYIHVPRSDAIFRSVVPVFHSSTAGLRYDIARFAAFKLQYPPYPPPDPPPFHA